ncbi:MAG: TIGR01777 family protein [Gemmatimonadetes bacterium]|nr:TIGR01777 family protein [Gemmatimonadota bacterium]
MRVAMTGATGLIGSALLSLLESNGHQVIPLRRGSSNDRTTPSWNPLSGDLSDAAVDGVDAVVHLAGENIAGGRWTKARKARIRDSRVHGTRHLSEALARLERPPKTLIVASAIGFYGDRGEERLHEQSSAGTGFLPEVCQAWEAAAEPAVSRGIRVVQLRLGIVLTPAGGALGQMLLPFKLGLGGVLGSGQQYMSWVALDDVLTSVLHALRTESLTGPVNVVAPHAVTNKEFTKTLGRVLRRPTFFPVPGFAARLLFGEMADALLLASTYVEPRRLQSTGFVFGYPALEPALKHVIST